MTPEQVQDIRLWAERVESQRPERVRSGFSRVSWETVETAFRHIRALCDLVDALRAEDEREGR